MQGRTGAYQSKRWKNPNSAFNYVERDLRRKGIRVSYTVTSDFRGDFDGDSVYVTRLPRDNNYALYMMHIMSPRRYCLDYYKRYTGTTAPSKDAVILRYMGLNVKEDGYL